MSQGHVVKWAMECEHDPLAPPLSAEKWKCLVLLAWAGDKTHNRIEMTTAEIAAMANLDADVAARFIRELRAEGPLRDTGERIGKNGRTAIYEFDPRWAPDARAQALARDAVKRARRGRIKHGANTVIESGDHGANTVINGTVDHGAGSVANTVIKAASIYGFNELPITPNKTKADGARNVIDRDPPKPLAAEASSPAAPETTDEVGDDSHAPEPAPLSRSCSTQASGTPERRAATASVSPPPSTTSNPRDPDAFIRAMRAQSIVVEQVWRIRERLCELIARGATLGMLPEAIRRARAKAKARKVPTEARALSVCDALASMLDARGGDPATVEDLVAQFRALCDQGLCSWTTHKVLRGTMLREFERLLRECIVTTNTMREALPRAQKRVGKVGRPSGAAIVAAMFAIAKKRPSGPPPAEPPSPGEDKPAFFERPARAAGTYAMPGNDTRH